MHSPLASGERKRYKRLDQHMNSCVKGEVSVVEDHYYRCGADTLRREMLCNGIYLEMFVGLGFKVRMSIAG